MSIRSPGKKTSDQKSVAVKWENYLATQKRKAAKGGKARAANLSKKELSEQARKAVLARWAKVKAAKKKRRNTAGS